MGTKASTVPIYAAENAPAGELSPNNDKSAAWCIPSGYTMPILKLLTCFNYSIPI